LLPKAEAAQEVQRVRQPARLVILERVPLLRVPPLAKRPEISLRPVATQIAAHPETTPLAKSLRERATPRLETLKRSEFGQFESRRV
jgi:hypothetical protein